MLFSKYLWPGAQAMELGFGEDDLKAECDKYVSGLGGFAKVRLTGRIIRALSKAGKGGKK